MQSRISSRERTFYLDVARAFAIFSITCNHAVNRAYDNYDHQQAEFQAYSLFSSILKAGVSVFSRLGVPIFLMITGTLFLNHCFDEQHNLKRFYRHNILRLLLTVEIWYLIMFWFLVLFDPTNTTLETKGIGGTLIQLLRTLLFQDQVTLGSMWYMPMILCLYTTIPLVAVAKEKLPTWALCIPLGLVFVNNMLLPAYNDFQAFRGGASLTSALKESNLCSKYYLYVFAGFLISSGVLRKLKSWPVALGAGGTFLLCCAYQLYAYSKPQNYLVSYDFPGILICAVFLFELFRRFSERLRPLRSGITYLSKISFGIYFVHIVIMESLNWYADWSLRPAVWMAVLEIVSFGGSILVIWLLAKIPACKKYLFMIKD